MNKRILWISISIIAVLLLTLTLVQPVFADADNVTFWVLDSYGNPLNGVTVFYNDYSNNWVPLGTTADGNPVMATFADGTYNIKAVKDYSQQVESVVVSGTGNQIFQTEDFTVHVKDSSGADYPDIAVAYNDYSNHYLSMGTTDSDGNASIELFPGTYTFRATKDHSTTKGDTSNTIEFQTGLFKVHVKDSSGADFEGIAVAYNDYSNHYLSMGNTDAYGYASIELFPGTYTFRATKDYSTVTGDTSDNIEFQTALFTVHVVNSSGNNYQGITIGYNDYSNHYLSMGTTASDGNASIELFPGTYTFKATEDHTEDVGVLSNDAPGTETIIEFPTAKAIGIVKDCDGTPLAGFKVAFNDYSNHWTNMGTTGVDGMASIQLFPGIRTIRAWIDYTYEVKDLELNWPESTVEFYPTKANFTYSGSVKYNDYSNHWKTMTSPFYLFPGTYTFMFDDDQQEIEISGCEMSLPYGDTNQPPTVTSEAADASGNEGSVLNTLGSFTDPDGDTLTITGTGAGTVIGNGDGTWSWNYTPTDNGAGSVIVTANDGKGGTATDTFDWTAYNIAPTATFGNNGPVDEGNNINLSLTSPFDPSSIDTIVGFVYAFDCGNGYGALSASSTATCSTTDNGTLEVKGKVLDKDGGFTEYKTNITVNNVAPTAVSLIPATPDSVVAINTPVSFDATFIDPAGTADESYTCNFNWDGDGTVDKNVTASYGSCSGDASYSTPGVYIVKLTVTDKDGGVSNEIEYQFVVVYDPSGGFVTGGGWIMSPEGAYTADPSLTGKATFGFVAKYKKGANLPDGNTEFQFKTGDLNFHSTSYEWLVVAGNKAQFKGEGTINGQGSYKFMIFADDDSPDTFRIQIWGDSGPVYDNGSNQALGGGSIVVHK